MPQAVAQGTDSQRSDKADSEAPMPRQRRAVVVLFTMLVLLLVTGVVAVGTGMVPIRPGQVLAILAQQVGVSLPWPYGSQHEAVLMTIRLHEVPGFESFFLLRGEESEGEVHYATHAVWASKEVFEARTKSDNFAQAHGGDPLPKGMVLGRPVLQRFEVLLELGSE